MDIEIPKPPNIRFPKTIGFVHFSKNLVPSEKYYNLQSLLITLYTGTISSRIVCEGKIWRNYERLTLAALGHAESASWVLTLLYQCGQKLNLNNCK